MTDITHLLFEFLVNIKYAHLMTDKYSEHKATDKLYDEFNELYDKYLETCAGKHGKNRIKTTKNININACNGDVKEYIKSVIKKIDIFYKKQETDLQSILDDIKISMNRCMYLLELN